MCFDWSPVATTFRGESQSVRKDVDEHEYNFESFTLLPVFHR